MSSTDPKMFQLVNKNTSQSCRFWIDSLILICHDEAVLLEEKLKQAKCNSLLSKFQFGEMIPFIMLDHMLCYFLNIICLELILKSNDQTKSNHIKWFFEIIHSDHSFEFIWSPLILPLLSLFLLTSKAWSYAASKLEPFGGDLHQCFKRM